MSIVRHGTVLLVSDCVVENVLSVFGFSPGDE